MRFTLTFFILISLLSLNSCKKDKEGSLTLHFKAFYNGQPVEMFSTRPGDGQEQLQLTHLSFLLSDVKLLNDDDGHDLTEIEYVDLSFDDPQDAEDGFSITFDQIPAGTYDGIRFGIGVPPDLNSKTPSDFSSTHPLSKTGYYWQAWSSFIFMKIEGRLDSVGNGNFDTGFAYHTGSDALFRFLDAQVSMGIEEGANEDLSIHIDYKDLLEGIDISTKPQNHNPEDSIQITRIVNNLQTSVLLFQ